MLQNNYTLSYFYKCVHIISFFNHNAQKDINNKKYMCHERNIMCIINRLLIRNCVHVLLCLYVYVYVLCYATFVFQGLHVVLFINKVTCPIYKCPIYETERATLLIYIQDNCKNFEHLSPNNKLIWLLSSEDTLLLNKLAVFLNKSFEIRKNHTLQI